MPISGTPVYFLGPPRSASASPIALASGRYSGLTATADNAVPHGLPAIPVAVSITPLMDGTANPGGWFECEAPDALHVHIHVNANGPTAFRLDMWYPE